jgi:hypothetical protein
LIGNCVFARDHGCMHPGMPLGRNRLRRSRDAPMWVSTPQGADELAAILKELLPMLGTKPLEVNLLDDWEQSKVPPPGPTHEVLRAVFAGMNHHPTMALPAPRTAQITITSRKPATNACEIADRTAIAVFASSPVGT